MQVGSFEVKVPEAEVGLYPNWFILNHKSEYTLELCNHSDSDCEVRVHIVGHLVFTLDLKAGEKRIIENPFQEKNARTYLPVSEVSARLIFYAKGSLEAVKRDKEYAEMRDYGVIQVSFSPRRVGEDIETIILYPAQKPTKKRTKRRTKKPS